LKFIIGLNIFFVNEGNKAGEFFHYPSGNFQLKLTSCLNCETLGARRGPGDTSPLGVFELLEHENLLVLGVTSVSDN
jgi:hypothetical protein